MKKISIISIVGVLLTGVCGDVMAASSLSASTNSAKVSMPRAASLRFGGARSASMGKAIAPKADVKTIAPKTAGTTAGRAASVSRTSVGRYIGANKEQSVSMAALPDSLLERVDTAETNITDLQDNKQDKLLDSEDGFIRVVDDTHITIDIPTLSDALPSQSQPNWDETDSTAPGYIQNKPEKVEICYNNAFGLRKKSEFKPIYVDDNVLKKELDLIFNAIPGGNDRRISASVVFVNDFYGKTTAETVESWINKNLK